MQKAADKSIFFGTPDGDFDGESKAERKSFFGFENVASHLDKAKSADPESQRFGLLSLFVLNGKTDFLPNPYFVISRNIDGDFDGE